MNNNATKTLIFVFALLLCLSAVGSCFALYSIDATPITITLTAAGGTVTPDPEPEKTLDSITASYDGTIYLGETYEINKLTVTAHYSNDTSETLTQDLYENNIVLSNGTTDTPGTVEYTVTYLTQSTTFNVTVIGQALPYLVGNYGSITNTTWEPHVNALTFATATGGNQYELLNVPLKAGDEIRVFDNKTDAWKNFAGTLPFGAHKVGDNLKIEYDGTYNFYYSSDDNIYVTSDVNGLYLKPNSNWTQSGAWFAAYFFGNGEKWVKMEDKNSDGIYEVIVSEVYPSVIFCRMNSGNTTLSWDAKWNQTGDLTVPTDGKNCYTVADGTWDKGGGTWSTN